MENLFHPLFVEVDVASIKRDEREPSYLDDLKESLALLMDQRDVLISLAPNISPVVMCPRCGEHEGRPGRMIWSVRAKAWCGIRHDHQMTAREMLLYVRDGYLRPPPTSVPGDGVPVLR